MSVNNFCTVHRIFSDRHLHKTYGANGLPDNPHNFWVLAQTPSQFYYGLCKDIHTRQRLYVTVVRYDTHNDMEVVIDMHIKLFRTPNFFLCLFLCFFSSLFITLWLRYSERWRVRSTCIFCIYLLVILQCHSNSGNINKILNRSLNIYLYTRWRSIYFALKLK